MLTGNGLEKSADLPLKRKNGPVFTRPAEREKLIKLFNAELYSIV